MNKNSLNQIKFNELKLGELLFNFQEKMVRNYAKRVITHHYSFYRPLNAVIKYLNTIMSDTESIRLIINRYIIITGYYALIENENKYPFVNRSVYLDKLLNNPDGIHTMDLFSDIPDNLVDVEFDLLFNNIKRLDFKTSNNIDGYNTTVNKVLKYFEKENKDKNEIMYPIYTMLRTPFSFFTTKIDLSVFDLKSSKKKSDLLICEALFNEKPFCFNFEVLDNNAMNKNIKSALSGKYDVELELVLGFLTNSIISNNQLNQTSVNFEYYRKDACLSLLNGSINFKIHELFNFINEKSKIDNEESSLDVDFSLITCDIDVKYNNQKYTYTNKGLIKR